MHQRFFRLKDASGSARSGNCISLSCDNAFIALLCAFDIAGLAPAKLFAFGDNFTPGDAFAFAFAFAFALPFAFGLGGGPSVLPSLA